MLFRSVSGRNLGEKKVQHDFLRAIGKAIKAGAVPASYDVFLASSQKVRDASAKTVAKSE